MMGGEASTAAWLRLASLNPVDTEANKIGHMVQ